MNQSFLFSNSSTSDKILFLLNKGLSSAEIVEEISNLFPEAKEITVQADVHALIKQITTQSTFVSNKELFEQANHKMAKILEFTVSYKGITISTNNSEVIKEIERHLGILLPTTTSIESDIIVENSANEYYIHHGGKYNQVIQHDLSTAAYEAHSLVNDILCKRLKPLAIFHAGGVYKEGKCALFPGKGGSGKSTLTAALGKRGYTILHDDYLPMDTQLRLHTVGDFLKIREQSWSALAQYYGDQLENRPIVSFADTNIKLMPIDHSALPNATKLKCNYIVVPHFQMAQSANRITEITSKQALEVIISSDSIFQKPLPEESFHNIINWVASVQSYNIEYDCTEAGIALVNEIMDKTQS